MEATVMPATAPVQKQQGLNQVVINKVQLSESADRIPNMGDRLEIDAVRLDKSSRNLLETTPACHCFEKNAETERQSLAEYLAESVVTVTGRRWSYGDGHTYCTLDVELQVCPAHHLLP